MRLNCALPEDSNYLNLQNVTNYNGYYVYLYLLLIVNKETSALLTFKHLIMFTSRNEPLKLGVS